MRGLLIVNSFLNTEKFRDIYSRLDCAFEKLNVTLSMRGNADFAHAVGSPLPLFENPDFVLFWDKDILLAREFEETGIPVFNSSRAIELCDDKRKMHLALTELPMPETFIAPMTFPNIGFPDLSFFASIEENLGYPMVIKEAFGSFGAQVYLAKNREEALCIIKRCESVPIIFQRFIKESMGRDIRINVVGHKVVSAMERRSNSDFRSNVTLGGETLHYAPTVEEIALAEDASRRLGLDFGGIDILFGERGPLICEVNSNTHFKSTCDCTGINLADLIAEHITKKVAK